MDIPIPNNNKRIIFEINAGQIFVIDNETFESGITIEIVAPLLIRRFDGMA